MLISFPNGFPELGPLQLTLNAGLGPPTVIFIAPFVAPLHIGADVAIADIGSG